VVAFRDSELGSRFWRTGAGDRLLKWFWKSRVGLWWTRKFAGATAEELHGYAFWGPVAFGILVTELLGTGWYSTRTRSISDGQDAWFVYFNDLTGGEQAYSGCFVVVKGRQATASPDCLIR
jgi:hypothetical protein